MNIYAALAALVAAIITGTVTYLVAKRTSSGTVDTSEAAELWTEGQQMRRELRDETVRLREELEKATAKAEEYRNEAQRLHEEVVLLRAEVARLQESLKGVRRNPRDEGEKHD